MADEAFLLGLMQDMAMPLMHQAAPDVYDQTICQEATSPAVLCQREVEVFGINHAQAARLWGAKVGIPDNLLVALQFHHEHDALVGSGMSPILAEAVHFSALFPHLPIHWIGPDALAAAKLVEDKLEIPPGNSTPSSSPSRPSTCAWPGMSGQTAPPAWT